MQLHWYDWITPTTPFASVFIGTLFILFLALIVWQDSRSFKTTGMVILAGFGILFISVTVLTSVGFYG